MIDTGTRQHTVTGVGIGGDPNESFGLRPERFFRRKMPSDHFFKSTESLLEHRNAVPEMRPVVCFGENLRGDQHVKPPPAGGDVGVQIRDACRQVESDAGEKRLASVGKFAAGSFERPAACDSGRPECAASRCRQRAKSWRCGGGSFFRCDDRPTNCWGLKRKLDQSAGHLRP